MQVQHATFTLDGLIRRDPPPLTRGQDESAMKRMPASASQREGTQTSVVGRKMLSVAKEQKGGRCGQSGENKAEQREP